MLRILIDGSGDMPEGWAEAYEFDILPMPIQIGSKTYYQGEDITPDEFYTLVRDKENVPQTAAPSPFRIKAFIEKVCNIGDTVLSISVSGKMSSTVSMVKHAARELADKIHVVTFDSLAGSAVLALMAREARLRARAGDSIETILEKLREIREKVTVVLTVDSLEFARRSGRVNALQAAVTSLLNIKPIITLKEGMMEMSEMVRTRKKSLERIVEKIYEKYADQALKIAIVHSQDPDTAVKLKEMVEAVMNSAEMILTELSISVAANLGPGTVGIVALPDDV
jgi:DegV family protein with EDD domain